MTAGRFDSELRVRVQQANDIADVISEHVRLTKKGREMVGLCPFHPDHRPSMNVSLSKQIFKCFACGVGGDVIKFVQMRENLTFKQALERLAQRAGIKIEPLLRRDGGEPLADEIEPKKLAETNLWAMKLWQGNLLDERKGKAARGYVEQRGISKETAAKWGLGLAIDSWDDLSTAAASSKLSQKLLEQGGFVVLREGGGFYDKFRNRLMFPIWDVTGRVIAFGGRTLGDDPAKYMNSPTTPLFDKSNSLYGLNHARHSIVSLDTAVVVEGYTDCIMAHQFGCENVVATLGTSLTAGHARLLRRYAGKIVLVFDSDIAGMEAANRALEIFLAEGIDIRIASVPEGKDPCDFLMSKGKEAFDNVVNNAVDVMEYKWRRLVSGFSGADTLSRQKSAAEEFLRSAAAAFAAGKIDVITRGLIVSRLSKVTGLDARNIDIEIAKRTGKSGSRGGFAVPNQKAVSVDLQQGFFGKAQKEVLEVLLNAPELYESVKKDIELEMFDVPMLREIAEVVFEFLEKQKQPVIADILANIESVEASNLVVEMAQSGEEKGNFAVRLEGVKKAFEEHKLAAARQRINDIDDESLRNFSKALQKQNPRASGI